MLRYTYSCPVAEPFALVQAWDSRCAAELHADRAQNVILRQLCFPSDLRQGDRVLDVWTHTLDPALRRSALSLLATRTYRSRYLITDSTDESFNTLCRAIAPPDFKVTGALCVQFTIPAADHYQPTLRITLHAMGSQVRETFSGMTGPHISSIPVSLPVPNPDTVAIDFASCPWIRVCLRSKRRHGPQTRPSLSLSESAPGAYIS